MNVNALYVVSKEPRAGSFFVSMGLMDILKRNFKRVAIFKPIVRGEKIDSDIETLLSVFEMRQRYEDAAGVEIDMVESYLARGEESRLYEQLITRFERLQNHYDFVLCLGMTDMHLKELVDFDVNVQIAKNFSVPVVGIVSAKEKEAEEVQEDIALWQQSLKEEGIRPFAFFINHVSDSLVCQMERFAPFPDTPCFPIPYEKKLDSPTVLDLISLTGGEILHMKDETALERIINKPLIAAMHPEHFLEHFEEKDLVVVPADRADIFLAILSANRIPGFPSASAIVVGGGMDIAPTVMKMIESDETFRVVLIKVPLTTLEIIMKAQRSEARITPRHRRKIALALGHFANHVDVGLIERSLKKTKIDIVTPVMFLHRIYAKASQHRMRVVLPESMDERILRAAETAQRRKIADITLLGNEEAVRNRAGMIGVDLEGVEVIDPVTSELKKRFAESFYRLRKHKGVTLENALDMVENVTYFATMMVHEGLADAMVSGATHTTRETVLPALQIIKTKPGIDIVSSVFFMCLDTRVLVYGDCAIVPDPNPKELAQIAIESAETAKAFGIEPIVAMLSYSTGESGVGADVEKVREATRIAKERRPDLLIEGPMQYDAAIDPAVAEKKMPGSKVAGRATVFIFPDLNTGNNTYKAVQRATGAIAIGPVLQGLRKPVNDLSRGCSVEDVVSTIAISAIQAQNIDEIQAAKD
ncbi:phosphate acetyltransferase [Hydrogenimonas urashimensis]|uniref:phosphate acetyltransferase n=1 Tax=Hydrogenimonas urashimensis TaxID=2740515 RepID=UPI001914FA8F|nr:phosphate acetyltransferase [Hydrogenimonas urashimensis]